MKSDDIQVPNSVEKRARNTQLLLHFINLVSEPTRLLWILMEVLRNPTHPTEDLICDTNKFSSNTLKVPWHSLNTLKSSSVFSRKWPAVESTSGEPMRLTVQLRNVLLLPYLYGEFVRLLFWEQTGKLWKRTDEWEWMNEYSLSSSKYLWNLERILFQNKWF